MAVEIEHKFLVSDERWRAQVQSSSRFVQGYLSRCPERTVRVRVAGDHAWLTIKGKSCGSRRAEYEYEIPAPDALEMLETLCERPLLEKWRHRIAVAGHVWEIDEFLGDNRGLVVAEIELEQVGEPFFRPDWLGAEVTDDHRYANASLVRHPYSQWQPS